MLHRATAAMDRTQFEATDLTQISADDLMGTERLFRSGRKTWGSVNDVLLTADGQVDASTRRYLVGSSAWALRKLRSAWTISS